MKKTIAFFTVVLVMASFVSAIEYDAQAEMNELPDEQEDPWTISPFASTPGPWNSARYFRVQDGILQTYVTGYYSYPSVYAYYYKPLSRNMDGGMTIQFRGRILGNEYKMMQFDLSYYDTDGNPHHNHVRLANYWNKPVGLHFLTDSERTIYEMSYADLAEFHDYEVQFTQHDGNMTIEGSIDGEVVMIKEYELIGYNWPTAPVNYNINGDGYGAIIIMSASYAFGTGGVDIDYVRILYDSDSDGINDASDNCPSEDATGFDADNDGCIDSFSGLTDVINNLDSDILSDNVRNSLVSKINNAIKQSTKDNICTAINVLGAFKNEINAQTGKKISEDAATLLINYADNLIAQLEDDLAAGESC